VCLAEAWYSGATRGVLALAVCVATAKAQMIREEDGKARGDDGWQKGQTVDQSMADVFWLCGDMFVPASWLFTRLDGHPASWG
jgi:hypothetical protein